MENIKPVLTNHQKFLEGFEIPPVGKITIAGETLGIEPDNAVTTGTGDSYNQFIDAFTGHLSASTSTPLEVVRTEFKW